MFFIPRLLLNLLTFPGFYLHDYLQSLVCKQKKIKCTLSGFKNFDDFMSGSIIEIEKEDFEKNRIVLTYLPLVLCSMTGIFLFSFLVFLVELEFQKLSLLFGWFAISASFRGYILNGFYNPVTEVLKFLGIEIAYVALLFYFSLSLLQFFYIA